MTDLYTLAKQDYDEDVEFEILPSTARLALKGPSRALNALLERAEAVAPVKPVVPNTQWIQLEAHGPEVGSLAFVRASANDGEVTMSTQSDELEVLREGSVLLPRKVAQIVKLAPEATVSLTVIGSSCVVRSGRAQWTVATPVGDALPPRPDTAAIVQFPIARTALLRALRVVQLVLAKGGSRAALQQALVREGKITASDAGRLHQVLVEGLPAEFETTLPIRVVDELVRACLASTVETVFLGSDELRVVAAVGRDDIVGQRMMVGYPNIEALVLQPAFTNDSSVTVKTGELVDAVKRARVNADPTTSAVTLDLTPASHGWQMVVTTIDRDGNSSREPIPAEWQGPKKGASFTVQHKSLLELIAGAGTETISFRVSVGTKTKKYPLLVETGSFTGVLQQVMVL